MRQHAKPACALTTQVSKRTSTSETNPGLSCKGSRSARYLRGSCSPQSRFRPCERRRSLRPLTRPTCGHDRNHLFGLHGRCSDGELHVVFISSQLNSHLGHSTTSMLHIAVKGRSPLRSNESRLRKIPLALIGFCFEFVETLHHLMESTLMTVYLSLVCVVAWTCCRSSRRTSNNEFI